MISWWVSESVLFQLYLVYRLSFWVGSKMNKDFGVGCVKYFVRKQYNWKAETSTLWKRYNENQLLPNQRTKYKRFVLFGFRSREQQRAHSVGGLLNKHGGPAERASRVRRPSALIRGAQTLPWLRHHSQTSLSKQQLSPAEI